MNGSIGLLLLGGFGIGVIAGLRSLTAPAVVSWAAHWGWLDLHGTRLAFLSSSAAAWIISILAVAELVNDKLPKTPNRTAPVPLTARILTGALSGAALWTAAQHSVAAGGIAGAVGGIVGAYVGYAIRRRLVRSGVPDFAVALVEDLVAIGGGFLLVAKVM